MKNTPSDLLSRATTQIQTMRTLSRTKKIAIATTGSVAIVLAGGTFLLSKTGTWSQEKDKATSEVRSQSRSGMIQSMEYPVSVQQNIAYKTTRPRAPAARVDDTIPVSDDNTLEVVWEWDIVMKTWDSPEARQKNLAAIKNMINLMNEREDNTAHKKKK